MHYGTSHNIYKRLRLAPMSVVNVGYVVMKTTTLQNNKSTFHSWHWSTFAENISLQIGTQRALYIKVCVTVSPKFSIFDTRKFDVYF